MSGRGLAALLLALSACGSGDGEQTPDVSATWTLALHDLDEALLSVWIGSPDEALLVGGTVEHGMILELAGDRWREVDVPPGTPLLWSVWALPGGVAVAGGEDGTILRREDSLWIRQPTDDLVSVGTRFFGAWGSGPDDIWVVGGSLSGVADPGVVVHWDGVSWTRALDPELRRGLIFKVWGTGPDDVFVVGEEGFISRWDGASWTTQPSGVGQRLLAVRGRGPDDVFAVGGDMTGIALHWDGTSWRPILEAPQPITGVAIVDGGPLLLSGMRGYLAELSADVDGTVSDLTVTPLDPETDFHAAAAIADLQLAVGADLLYGGRPSWRGALACDRPVARAITRGLDAGWLDAAPDAPIPLIDSSLPGPGEDCLVPPAFPNCQPGLECWLFLSVGQAVCTKPCRSEDECGGAYAPACCERPGPQTLETVCMPEARGACGSVEPVPDAAP